VTRDPFDLTACRFHAEGESGPWRLERHTHVNITFRDPTPSGTYTGLLRHGQVWMSDVPDEKRDHYPALHAARKFGGRCLVNGLGLGMVVKAMLDLPNVTHVDVVELDPDVITLAGPAFDRYGSRVTIHQDDVLTRRWPPRIRWTVVWHDIWPSICEDNLPDMQRLHRSYGRRCDWQGSWARERILLERRRASGAWWR
jgi:hypothetical protein